MNLELDDPQDPQGQDPQPSLRDRMFAAAGQILQNPPAEPKNKPDGYEDLRNRLVADAPRLAAMSTNEALGFWENTGALATRAARGLADVWTNTVNRSTYGLSLIHQHAIHALNVIGSMERGQPLGPDEPLPEARGIIDLTTGKQDSDALDLLQTLGVVDNAARTRVQQSDALREWEMPAAIAGELAGMVGVGPNAEVGRLTSGFVSAAVQMAQPATRYLNRLVRTGKITQEAAEQAVKTGNVLLEIAKHEGLDPRVGRIMQKVADKAPGLAGEYAGLLMQTYAATPRPEAAEAMRQTAMLGPVFLGVGRVARMLGDKALDMSLSPAAREAYLKLSDAMQSGRQPSLYRTLAAIPAVDAAKVVGIEALTAGLEAGGFTLMNRETLDAIADAYAGVPGSWGRLSAHLGGTWAGLLMGKGLSYNQVPYFRRLRPDLQSIRTERERQQAEREAKQQAEQDAQKAKQAERDDTTRRGVEAAQLVGQERARQQREAQDIAAKEQAVQGDMAVAPMADPLLRSGWSIEHALVDQPIPEVKIQSEDGHSVTMRVPAPGVAMLDVPPALLRLVRPGQPLPDGPLVGQEAAEFLTDLGLRSSAMGMRQTLRFGRLGMVETRAGGPWKDPNTGRYYTIGLDGEPMTRGPMDKKWVPIPKEDPIEWLMREPIGELQGDPSWWVPQMDNWSTFAHQKSRAFPDELDEILSIAINTAQYGGNTDSANELRSFFQSVPPEAVIPLLGPRTQKALGHIIASVGGGLSNHQEAIRLIQEMGKLAGLLGAPRPQPDVQSEPGGEDAMEAEGAPPKPQGPGLTLSELYSGIPLKNLWSGLARITEMAATGEPPESKGRDVPSKQDVPERPTRAPLGASYWQDLVDQVGRYGGEFGQKVRQDAMAAGERYRDVWGRAESAGIADAAQRAAGRKGYGEARDWLESGVEESEGYRTSRHHLLLEGIAADEPVPPKADEILQDYRKFRLQTGQEAADPEVDTIRPGRDGEHERFVPNPEANIAVRTDLTDAYRDAFRRPEDPRNEEILRRVSEHPRNNRTPEQTDQFVKRAKEQAARPDQSSVEAKTATEVLRDMPFVPDEVRLKSGEWVRLRDKSAANALMSMVRSEIQGIASRAFTGQDLPKAARERLGYRKIGPTETLERMRVASGDDKRAIQLTQALIRRFEGLGEEGWFPEWKGTTRRILSEIEQTVRTDMLSGAWKQNLFEIFSTMAHNTGFARAALGMVRAGWSPKQVAQHAYDMGALLRDLSGHDITQAGGVLKAIRKVLGLRFALSQGLASRGAFVAAESRVRAMANRKLTADDESLLQAHGYTDKQIDEIRAAGGPSEDIRRHLVQRMVRAATSEKTRAEASLLAGSKKWNALFPFDRWYMTRVGSTIRLAESMRRAFLSGSPSAISNSVIKAVTFLAGSTAGGLAGNFLGLAASRMSFEDAYDEFVRRLHNDGIATTLAKMGFASAFFGGRLQAGYSLVMDKSRSPAQRVADAAAPTSRLSEVIAFYDQQDQYRDQDPGSRLITLASRFFPSTRDVRALGALMGLADQAGPFAAAISAKGRAARDLGFPIDPARAEDPTDIPFHTAIRSLRDVIRNGVTKDAPDVFLRKLIDSSQFQDAMGRALSLGTGRDISAALMAARSLYGYRPEELSKLTDRIGPENANVLYAHDRAVEMLAKAFRKEKGTERQVFPPIEERLETAEQQVALGNGGGVWRSIYDQVMDDATEAVRVGGRIPEDVRRLAITMSRHPDTLERILGPKQNHVIQRLGPADAANLLERFFIETARNRVRGDRREQARGY